MKALIVIAVVEVFALLALALITWHHAKMLHEIDQWANEIDSYLLRLEQSNNNDPEFEEQQESEPLQ